MTKKGLRGRVQESQQWTSEIQTMRQLGGGRISPGVDRAAVDGGRVLQREKPASQERFVYFVRTFGLR